MTPARLLFMIRFFGAGITAGLFGHQCQTIAHNWGVDFLSVSYLFAVLAFYLFLYLVRFFVPHNIDDEEKSILFIQVILSLISAGMIIYEACEHSKNFDLHTCLHIILAMVFIFLPDMVYRLLIKVYSLLTKNYSNSQ